jgi:hypothetical protein
MAPCRAAQATLSRSRVLTDPPYLVRYCSRDGRTIANDADGSWLSPAFAEIFRILPRDGFCVTFYGWSQADRFIAAWRHAGFRLAGHFSFPKVYASTERFCATTTRAPICSSRAIRSGRCHRVEVFRQPAASGAETAVRPDTAHRVVLAPRRPCRGPVLRLGLHVARSQARRTALLRHRAFFFFRVSGHAPGKRKTAQTRVSASSIPAFLSRPDSRDSGVREEMIFDRSSRRTTAGHVPAAGRKLKMR